MSLVGKNVTHKNDDTIKSIEVIEERAMDAVLGRVTHADGTVASELRTFKITVLNLPDGQDVDEKKEKPVTSTRDTTKKSSDK